jgi:hypothetical protein
MSMFFRELSYFGDPASKMPLRNLLFRITLIPNIVHQLFNLPVFTTAAEVHVKQTVKLQA